MFSFVVQNESGNRINLSNDARYALYKIDGLNPPSSSLNFTTIVNLDGQKYNNSGRLNSRNIVIYVKIYPDAEKNRNALYEYFTVGKKIRMFYKNGVHDVYIDGYIETFECDFFSYNETVQISVICADPYFRDSKKTDVSFSRVVSMFEFPFETPPEIEFGTIERRNSVTVDAGNIETGIEIEFIATGDLVLHPKFINLTNGQYIYLTGEDAVMNTGDVIKINTNRHNKSITKIYTDDSGNIVEKNILFARTTDSVWVQLNSGLNELTYTSDEYPENLIVNVSFDKLIQGV